MPSGLWSQRANLRGPAPLGRVTLLPAQLIPPAPISLATQQERGFSLGSRLADVASLNGSQKQDVLEGIGFKVSSNYLVLRSTLQPSPVRKQITRGVLLPISQPWKSQELA